MKPEDIFTEENLLSDLKGMSKDALVAELLRFRMTLPQMASICREIEAYRKIADSPEQFMTKMNSIVDTYKAAIVLKDKQIQELISVVQQLRDDPLGIESRFSSNNATKNTRTH